MDTQDRYAQDFAMEQYHRQDDVSILDKTILPLHGYNFDADFATAKDGESPPDFFCYSLDSSNQC